MADTGQELIGAEEAARMLEVTRDRVDVMVEEGLLTPVGDGEATLFARAEVLGVREMGG